MNTGYKLCDGELITFCDGDDWYFPEKIEREVEFLKTHPDVDVVHSNFDYYTIEGKFTKHWATNEKQIPQGDIYLPLLSLQYPDSVHLRFEMTSKKILEETGYYDDRIPVWVDWDLRLRLAAKHKYGYCHYIGSAYAENPTGITQVNKQETVLKFLEFVIGKNKEHLSHYSSSEAKKAMKAINKHVKGLRLAINFRNHQHSFSSTLKYLAEYPRQIRDWRFILHSMFGMSFMQSMANIKQKLLGKR
jgi:glycosyltransferase involved in cell wall biosynthesis